MSECTLVFYNAAKQALAQAASIDEVKDINYKAAAMKLYAQQQQDDQLEKYANEIKVRAAYRLGQLISDLEKGKGAGCGKGKELPSSGQFKEDALETPTSRGYLMPIADAEKYCLRKIDVNEDQHG